MTYKTDKLNQTKPQCALQTKFKPFLTSAHHVPRPKTYLSDSNLSGTRVLKIKPLTIPVTHLNDTLVNLCSD